MPIRVPQYEEQVKTVTPHLETPKGPERTVPGVVRGAFGENVAQAQQDIGQGLSQLGQQMLKIEQDEQDKEELKRETAFRQEVQVRLSDRGRETLNVNGQEIERPRGYLNRELGQAKGVTQEFDTYYYKELRDKYAKGLSKYQLAKLAPAMDNYYTSTRDTLIVHEARELEKDFMEETKANLEQKTLDASLIRDPDNLKIAIDDGIKSAEPFNAKFGPATRKLLNEKIAEDITKAAVIATIERSGDYVQAKMMLDGIKENIPDSVYNKISDEIGSRAVDIAISGDNSITQEDSSVMQELQKGSKGDFAFLATSERIKAIKESQQRIVNNSQIAKQNIKEAQLVRNDNIIKKVNDQTLTLADIEREMSIPEEQGGIPRKTLLQYKRGVVQGIKTSLDKELKQSTTGIPIGTKGAGEPTATAKRVRQYLNLIDLYLDDKTDALYASEKLAEAYSDGITNPKETAFLNDLKQNLKEIQYNRSTEAKKGWIKSLKQALDDTKATDEEVAIKIKQLLGTQNMNQETVKKLSAEHVKSKVPEATTAPETGQLMMDGNGNIAMIYPDGTIEPYIKQPKTKKPGTTEEKK